MKIRIIIAIAAILLLGIVFRFAQVLPYPTGSGKSVVSPNKQLTKRLTARASNMTDRYFFGGERHYYEFIIEVTARDNYRLPLRRIVIDEPREGMIDWRHEGTKQWSDDGLTVTFHSRTRS